MPRTMTTRVLLLFPFSLLVACNQLTPTSPCETASTKNAVLVELGLATVDAVDGVKAVGDVSHAIKVTSEEQPDPSRVVCNTTLSITGPFEAQLQTLLGLFGREAMQAVYRGADQLEGSVEMEIDALAKDQPNRYASYKQVNADPTAEQAYLATEFTFTVPVRYAVNPEQPDALLGVKFGENVSSALISQLHLQALSTTKRISRELGEKAAAEAKAAGFDSSAEYEAARTAQQEATQRVQTLQADLAAAKQQLASLEGKAKTAKTALATAQVDHDRAAAKYKQFMRAVKAGNGSSHPKLLRYSNLRLEQADRGRVKIKGSVSNVSGKPLKDWVADVYMYRPDLDRVFVGVAKYFDFYGSGERIGAGATKTIEEWIVDFNGLDRGGNTSEQVFRNVKPASIYMHHTKIRDASKNTVIPTVKNSTDMRRLMENPDKALADAKAALATSKKQLAATNQQIDQLTNDLKQAEQALAKAAIGNPS